MRRGRANVINLSVIRGVLKRSFSRAANRLFWEQVSTYGAELTSLPEISLDPVREALADWCCPTGNGAPKDACAMLRSWLTMTLCREGCPTVWATRLKREPVWAILAGFAPGQTPCATTHLDFLKRLADGPYAGLMKIRYLRRVFEGAG